MQVLISRLASERGARGAGGAVHGRQKIANKAVRLERAFMNKTRKSIVFSQTIALVKNTTYFVNDNNVLPASNHMNADVKAR